MPGQIQITDRSGATATIDLSQARTVDDVINDINSNSTIHVTASGRRQLVRSDRQYGPDRQQSEGQRGQRWHDGRLARTGQRQFGHQPGHRVERAVAVQWPAALALNQGIGVQFDYALPDLQVNFADGTNATVDFNQLPTIGTLAAGTTDAANGKNAAVTFTAVNAGSAYAGVAVEFVNDTVGDRGTRNRLLRFDQQDPAIPHRAGHTTANDIINAVKQNSTVSALFTATTGPRGNGTGLVSVSDIAARPPGRSRRPRRRPCRPTPRSSSPPFKGGSAYDGVSVEFVNNPAITAGHETVAYDATSKTLTFQIAAGTTTANDVIQRPEQRPDGQPVFTAAAAPGSNGTGLVSTGDTATTSGGAIVEPSPGSPTPRWAT